MDTENATVNRGCVRDQKKATCFVPPAPNGAARPEHLFYRNPVPRTPLSYASSGCKPSLHLSFDSVATRYSPPGEERDGILVEHLGSRIDCTVSKLRFSHHPETRFTSMGKRRGTGTKQTGRKPAKLGTLVFSLFHPVITICRMSITPYHHLTLIACSERYRGPAGVPT